MIAVLAVVQFLLYLMLLLLMFRMVLDWVQSFARGWRPRGIVLVFASAVYSVTDPPMRWVRRAIPPLNLGGLQLDMGFLVVFFAVVLLRSLVGGLLSSAVLG